MDVEKGPIAASSHEEIVKTFLSSPEADSDFRIQYLWRLIDEITECGKKMTRWVVLSIVLICFFELLNRNLISEASISGIKISHFTFLLYAIPPLVAFIMLTFLALATEQDIFDKTIRELAKAHFSDLQRTDLIELLYADLSVFGNLIPKSLLSNKRNRGLNTYFVVQAGTFLLLYPIFELYAYTQLFKHSGLTNVTAIASAIISAFLSVIAFYIFIAAFASDAT